MKLMTEVRGLRNNNPGNICKNVNVNWNGEVKELPGVKEELRFCQFSSFDYGVRAIYKVLMNYAYKYNIKTPEEIINRWAPPTENDTQSYVNSVKQGLEKNQHKYGFYPSIVNSIILHENGFNPFSMEYLESIYFATKDKKNSLNIVPKVKRTY